MVKFQLVLEQKFYVKKKLETLKKKCIAKKNLRLYTNQIGSYIHFLAHIQVCVWKDETKAWTNLVWRTAFNCKNWWEWLPKVHLNLTVKEDIFDRINKCNTCKTNLFLVYKHSIQWTSCGLPVKARRSSYIWRKMSHKTAFCATHFPFVQSFLFQVFRRKIESEIGPFTLS